MNLAIDKGIGLSIVALTPFEPVFFTLNIR
ncbi:hypothetical protein D030_4867A, partial [Vibrio parahaemolyticus AQ3810]